MLTNVVSQAGTRASSLQSSACATRVLRPTAVSSLLKARHPQQTRAYRMDLWPSHCDPEARRDTRRSHRKLKYKYTESFNRTLSRDQDHPAAKEHRFWLHYIDHNYWAVAKRENNSKAGGYDTGKHPSGDTAAGKDTSDQSSWRSQLNNVVNELSKQASPGAKRTVSPAASSTLRANATANSASIEEEYVIDPITNRKVLRKSYGSVGDETKAPATTCKSNRSINSNLAPPQDGQARTPIHSNGPPPAAELVKYDQVEIDHMSEGAQSLDYSTTADMFSKAQNDTTQAPVIESEEYALNHLPPEETTEVYDDFSKHEPCRHDESELPTTNPTEKYNDLNQYKPDKYDEVDSTEIPSKPAYDDLDEYRPTEYSEDPAIEEPAPKYDDLDQYKYKHQEDVKVDETAPKYDDLDKYKSDNFEKYEEAPEPGPKYDDLEKYNPKEFPDAESAEYGEPFQQYGDLEKYKAYRYQELGGKGTPDQDIVGKGLKEYDAKLENRAQLEEAMENRIRASDAVDKQASVDVQKSRQSVQDEKSTLTDNFVLDFPEEFATSWSENASSSEAGLQQKLGTDARGHDASPRALWTAYEQGKQTGKNKAFEGLSYSSSSEAKFSKLESSLDRSHGCLSRLERREAEVDPYSKAPQGLETSYSEECGTLPTWPTFVKMYGSLQNKDMEDLAAASDTATADTPAGKEEPTIYKILAYDPTMQNINIAETTSVVPDQASPLSPTEVLLRLSNPTKFFPHFAPLQAEGFEIVSGSGDVLVFRKVRDAAAPATAKAKASPVNPIDMMGKPTALPNAAAFASPTGFVNYDIPPVEEAQTPPFRSMIDVQREETVFSGPKSFSSEGRKKNKKKKRGLVKRVFIAGASVAGISYALGIVSQYFVTGGIDGKGPMGF
ncbi:uncharacterized protein BCR38DRAFT_408631 [Pseudomassariella vexata]|uniref:Uncharacterized protein n=1 Tax=Pseudomassariella vexata TaxID=1141098 RepID=A0A1Y2E054_9PEZI|nr:uncharacterized protein BCR38DRAFT_408631 [Pseudomassariella vexata]ORY64867.1 hypothetical protein BCR38DRAFT_408631 [Pseudomassariella vexata]